MRSILFILLLLTGGVFSFAQVLTIPGTDTLTTDEIIVEANRLKMTGLLAPNKIQVLGRKLLAALNGSRLSDALETGDADFIRDYGFNSGLKTISLNSTQSEHTLVLLDGIRLNSKQNSQVDLSLYDISDVTRIEISKGGSSSLYGSEAIGGVVNIITGRKRLSKSFETALKSNIGSFGFRRFSGRISKDIIISRSSWLQIDVSGSDERARNDFDFYRKDGNTTVLSTRENNEYNAQTADVGIKLVNKDSSALKFAMHYTKFDRGLPGVDAGYSPGTARQIDDNSIVSLDYNRRLSPLFSLNSSLSYANQLEKYFDTATYSLAVKINSFYKVNNYSGTSAFTFAFSRQYEFQTGIEISHSNINSNEVEDSKITNAALYAAGKMVFVQKFLRKFTFYPSVRYDYYSSIKDKSVFTGKFGMNLKPFADTDCSLKLSVGNNFRAPTFNELYWKNYGNPNLKPERSVSLDAGILYSFDSGFKNEFEFSYFFTRTTDRIIWQPFTPTLWSPVNVGIVEAEGIDLSFNSGFTASTVFSGSIRADYSYAKATKKNEDYAGDPSYDKQLIYLPKETVKTSLMLLYLTTSKIIKFVSFNLFYKHASRRYSNFENTEYIPGYSTMDCNAAFGISAGKSQISLKLIVNNVLNEDYKVVPGYPMPLRNFKLELSFKY